MKKNGDNEHLPRTVARNILKAAARAAARGDSAIVITVPKGKPSRVFGYDEYQKIKQQPHEVKPWEKRQGQGSVPDPLGAVDMGLLLSPLTRETMYEE